MRVHTPVSYTHLDVYKRQAYDQRVLHKGDNFSVLKLEEERQRLSTLFRNNGYYYFRPEFITFRVGFIGIRAWKGSEGCFL